jgi:hypothetical protein
MAGKNHKAERVQQKGDEKVPRWERNVQQLMIKNIHGQIVKLKRCVHEPTIEDIRR